MVTITFGSGSSPSPRPEEEYRAIVKRCLDGSATHRDEDRYWQLCELLPKNVRDRIERQAAR
jgi:hypothetical protein